MNTARTPISKTNKVNNAKNWHLNEQSFFFYRQITKLTTKKQGNCLLCSVHIIKGMNLNTVTFKKSAVLSNNWVYTTNKNKHGW